MKKIPLLAFWTSEQLEFAATLTKGVNAGSPLFGLIVNGWLGMTGESDVCPWDSRQRLIRSSVCHIIRIV